MRGLYLVTPNWDDTAKLLAVTEQALAAGRDAGAGAHGAHGANASANTNTNTNANANAIAMLQYRHKTASPALRLVQATALQALCRRYACPFIVNDYVDLAQALDADGVHLGGSDAAVATVRAALGADKIIGASCYGDLALAEQAQAGGTSYVAFGGFYASQVKVYPVTTSATLLDALPGRIHLPSVVIGGMTPANAAPLVARGAAMVAAISSVYLAADPGAAVRAFHALYAP